MHAGVFLFTSHKHLSVSAEVLLLCLKSLAALYPTHTHTHTHSPLLFLLSTSLPSSFLSCLYSCLPHLASFSSHPFHLSFSCLLSSFLLSSPPLLLYSPVSSPPSFSCVLLSSFTLLSPLLLPSLVSSSPPLFSRLLSSFLLRSPPSFSSHFFFSFTFSWPSSRSSLSATATRRRGC